MEGYQQMGYSPVGFPGGYQVFCAPTQQQQSFQQVPQQMSMPFPAQGGVVPPAVGMKGVPCPFPTPAPPKEGGGTTTTSPLADLASVAAGAAPISSMPPTKRKMQPSHSAVQSISWPSPA